MTLSGEEWTLRIFKGIWVSFLVLTIDVLFHAFAFGFYPVETVGTFHVLLPTLSGIIIGRVSRDGKELACTLAIVTSFLLGVILVELPMATSPVFYGMITIMGRYTVTHAIFSIFIIMGVALPAYFLRFAEIHGRAMSGRRYSLTLTALATLVVAMTFLHIVFLSPKLSPIVVAPVWLERIEDCSIRQGPLKGFLYPPLLDGCPTPSKAETVLYWPIPHDIPFPHLFWVSFLGFEDEISSSRAYETILGNIEAQPIVKKRELENRGTQRSNVLDESGL